MNESDMVLSGGVHLKGKVFFTRSHKTNLVDLCRRLSNKGDRCKAEREGARGTSRLGFVRLSFVFVIPIFLIS